MINVPNYADRAPRVDEHYDVLSCWEPLISIIGNDPRHEGLLWHRGCLALLPLGLDAQNPIGEPAKAIFVVVVVVFSDTTVPVLVIAVVAPHVVVVLTVALPLVLPVVSVTKFDVVVPYSGEGFDFFAFEGVAYLCVAEVGVAADAALDAEEDRCWFVGG